MKYAATYCCPTSTNAKKLGFDDTGCWYVQEVSDKPPFRIASVGFQNKADAERVAANMNQEDKNV